ncbi:hypothetical protein ASPWEDRAFT_59439 [Aspergillus wentii DTO 134E9]|uniref:Ketoreductase (KR) domain-containing protein n=1 Tax=Aspergillus wentii DTO 134E9 TaxID=1073089 RepID=A0A1L9RJ24_ASPWE|nr:uncharacterized protein ASPWEDRAFT_59439 [Aspergillus wentii DTO 134E9]OJJ34925.1 hypothetical protein ASPWEDRAFT_59439 [Aspergillus wentii DTO 134E9]
MCRTSLRHDRMLGSEEHPVCIPNLFLKPEVPVADFTDQTIIATVSNVGLGKEACKYFVRMNAARVIATVRNESRRLSALREIEKETGRKGIVELWELDYGRYDSVLVFGERVKKALQRLDKVVLNAGVATWNWELLEEHESIIIVNVISTTLLSCILLSVLQRSARLNGSDPALSILLQIFVVREIVARIQNAEPFVTINTLNPGMCYTDLTRSAEGFAKIFLIVMRALIAWTAEEGSRTLVHATMQAKRAMARSSPAATSSRSAKTLRIIDMG